MRLPWYRAKTEDATVKKKLLVILGAGSSIPCDMPCVSDLDVRMEGWSDAWARERGFANHYRALKDAIKRYYSGVGPPKPTLNFEKILGDMVSLSHWMTPAPFGDTLR